MPTIKIATFNANNLFLRYKFGRAYPGSFVMEELAERQGYIPLYRQGSFEEFNEEQRIMAFRALTDDGNSYPDIICFQEIENLIALRDFNLKYMQGYYPFSLLVDSYDYRQIDVGILSRFEILNVRTNVDTLDPTYNGNNLFDYASRHLFSRDCLEVTVKNGNSTLSLFLNHFKSKMIGIPPNGIADPALWRMQEKVKADAKRLRQSTEVKRILQERFVGNLYNTTDFIVLGDFNEHPNAAPVQPIYSQANLEDVIARIPNPEDRWTHYWSSERSVSQLDHILVSPSLSNRTAGILPYIERRAIGFKNPSSVAGFLPKQVKFETMDNDPNPVELDFQFPRFNGITDKVDASDHCPIFFEIPV